MKILKPLLFLAIALLVLSCNKDDDGDNVPEANYAALINGGTFNNYNSVMNFYDVSTALDRLTLNITDNNNHIIRIFLNNTGGYGSGISKTIGAADSDGFVTTVTIRDQDNMITYTSVSGTVTITSNNEKPGDSEYRLISGNFNIDATTSTGDTVNMSGTFSNMQYLNF